MSRQPNVYHNYDEVTAILQRWAAHPLCSLESLGQATDGKDVWLLTLTDGTTGSHESKPAFWCDGNMHAGEVTGCEAALHLVETLLNQWDAGDAWTREVLGTSTVYVVPRISPDGAEFMLTTPFSCRSSPVKLESKEYPGFIADDVDGNGKCLLMRQEDSAGPFKASAKDPRIMVQRLPHERDPSVKYYRLWPEGVYRDYDGATQRVAPGAAYSLDANRQYPFNFAPEGEQRGAGDLPGHLPQVRAAYEAITARPNIAVLMNYHTYGAMVIRPPEDELGSDFGTYDALTRLGCELTGYAEVVLSNKWMHGDSVAWAIEHRGIVSFCNELWNAMEHVLKEHGEDFDHTADLGAGPVTPDMVGTREEDYVRLYSW
jgi:murein tripeptide amidase MpaA